MRPGAVGNARTSRKLSAMLALKGSRDIGGTGSGAERPAPPAAPPAAAHGRQASAVLGAAAFADDLAAPRHLCHLAQIGQVLVDVRLVAG